MPTDPQSDTDASDVIRDDDDVKAIAVLKEAYGQMTDQLSRVIVGQSAVIEQVLVSNLRFSFDPVTDNTPSFLRR